MVTGTHDIAIPLKSDICFDFTLAEVSLFIPGQPMSDNILSSNLYKELSLSKYITHNFHIWKAHLLFKT